MAVPFYKRRSVQLLVGIVVSAFFLWLATKDVVSDPKKRQEIVDAFRKANYSSLPVIWLVLFLFYWIKAWRWSMLLEPVGKFRPLRDLFSPLMIGFAFNNLLPAHLGDVVRVFVFAGQRDIRKTAVLSTVILERVFDIIAILCFLCTGLLLAQGLDDSLRQTALFFGAASACGVVAAAAYVVWTPQFVRLAEWGMNAVPILPVGLRGKIAGMMEGGAAGLASLKSARSLAGIAFSSLLQWALNGSLVYLSIWSFGIKVESPILVSCIVLGVVAFGVTVPSTPGYFGVIQFFFMSALLLFTNDEANAFAASIYYHLSQYIPVTIVGLLFMFFQGLNMGKVQSLASAEKAKAGEADDGRSRASALGSPASLATPLPSQRPE